MVYFCAPFCVSEWEYERLTDVQYTFLSCLYHWLQIPPKGTATLSVSLVAVKSGTVALPAIALVWDRGLNNSIALYEVGQSDAHVQRVFVSPH